MLCCCPSNSNSGAPRGSLLTIVDDPHPPLRMPFGSDTVAGIEAKNAFVAEELAKWRDLAISTDYPVQAVSA